MLVCVCVVQCVHIYICNNPGFFTVTLKFLFFFWIRHWKPGHAYKSSALKEIWPRFTQKKYFYQRNPGEISTQVTSNAKDIDLRQKYLWDSEGFTDMQTKVKAPFVLVCCRGRRSPDFAHFIQIDMVNMTCIVLVSGGWGIDMDIRASSASY